MFSKFLAHRRLKICGIQQAISSVVLPANAVIFLHRHHLPAGSHTRLHILESVPLRTNPHIPGKRRPIPNLRPSHHPSTLAAPLSPSALLQHSQRPVHPTPRHQDTILIPTRTDLAPRKEGNMGMSRMSNARPDARLARRKEGRLGSVVRSKGMAVGTHILGTLHLPDLLRPSPVAHLGVIRRLQGTGRRRVVLLMDLLLSLPNILAALVTAMAVLPKVLLHTGRHKDLLMEDLLKARLGVDTGPRRRDKVDGVNGETVLLMESERVWIICS